MKRLLHGPSAKRVAYATAQYKCGKCGRELTLLGLHADRVHLRTPKCSAVSMTQVYYADNISEPKDALKLKLKDSNSKWVSVNSVPGDKSKHERDAGQSPELGNRGYEYAHVVSSRSSTGLHRRALRDALSRPLEPGETLSDMLLRRNRALYGE